MPRCVQPSGVDASIEGAMFLPSPQAEAQPRGNGDGDGDQCHGQDGDRQPPGELT
jgi:hypothetical protein